METQTINPTLEIIPITPAALVDTIASMEPDAPNTWIDRSHDIPRYLIHTPNNGIWIHYELPERITRYEIC